MRVCMPSGLSWGLAQRSVAKMGVTLRCPKLCKERNLAMSDLLLTQASRVNSVACLLGLVAALAVIPRQPVGPPMAPRRHRERVRPGTWKVQMLQRLLLQIMRTYRMVRALLVVAERAGKGGMMVVRLTATTLTGETPQP